MEFDIARKIMVDCQVRPNDVTDPAIIDAFASVPREAFVPEPVQSVAYSEVELSTVSGRALWSARDQAKLLQELELKSTDLALIIGAGEGYGAALLNQIVDTVIALEESEELVELAGEGLTSLGYDRVAYVAGKLEDGFASEGPYDAIFVNGCVERIPDTWLDQLKIGGRLGVVLVDGDASHALIFMKTEAGVSHRNTFECRPPKLSELNKAEVFEF